MTRPTTEFDQKLDLIDHYQKYPDMRPWVGIAYSKQLIKILTVGESHYLGKRSTYHHDINTWYEGISLEGKKDRAGVHTRNVIYNGINSNWKKKSKTIFKNTEAALFASNIFESNPLSAYDNIAYLNYFQRPAERHGESIKVKQQDKDVSREVFRGVIEIIQPSIVIFTSTLAFNAAKSSGVTEWFKDNAIPFTRTPHPGCSWWNRVSKKYGNKTGREHFINFVIQHSNLTNRS